MIAAVLSIALAVTYEARGVIWADSVDLPDAAFQISQPAEYTVWAWTHPAMPASVTVNGSTMPLQAAANASDTHVWTQAGTITLGASAVTISVEGPVATVALSAVPGFDPATAMGNIRAQTSAAPPTDARLGIERETNTTFAMTPFESKESWEMFASDLRRTIQVACGLLPLPEKNPLNARIEPVADHGDYIVEKIYFEPFPGFLASGNLYRPKGDGPFPAVICPHGHWERGRLENAERGSVPGRCITFARMGMVAFAYDMIGYNDSVQFKHDMGTEDNNDQERRIRLLYGLHPFAMQTLTSLRVIDLMQELPYVNRENIACTGASGGGTQTFIVTAIDPRVKIASPVNMISHTMQGGCICENAPLIRIHASNMEIGALTAPRPMLMVSASGDWTRATTDVEYPAIKGIYALYGSEDRLAHAHVDAPHNYNQASREAVYKFFGKWVIDKADQYKDFTEPPFEVDADEAMLLNKEKQVPSGYPSGEEVMRSMKAAYATKWKALLPKGELALEAFRTAYGPALNDIIAASVPDPKSVLGASLATDTFDAHVREHLILGRDGVGDSLPAILYTPAANANGKGVVMVHGRGKGALADLSRGVPGEYINVFVKAGFAVLTVDPLLVGENQGPKESVTRTVKAFPDTFLPTDTAYRIQDVLTAVAFLRGKLGSSEAVGLLGLEDAGVWALFASALDTNIPVTAVDLRTANLDDDAVWANRFYLPSIRSVGDAVTAAVLIAPRRLIVISQGGASTPGEMQKAYFSASPQGSIVTMESTAPPPGAIVSSFQ
ncbi:MAG: hypothetical protein AMXMBFR84_38130 [Candidatus Hydrogenedentota bacterium]